MNKLHTLNIESPLNGRTYIHGLLICRGSVLHQTNECNTNQLTIDSSINVPINPNTGRFSCLIELEPGTNTLTFNHRCSPTVTITIQLVENLQTTKRVVPLYIVCKNHDGHFQSPDFTNSTPANAAKRINLACKLLQAVFAVNLQKTFAVRGCVVFHSQLDVSRAVGMSQLELWGWLAREIVGSQLGGDVDANKYLGFLGCTRFKGGLRVGYAAYGGGALALLGTGCMYTWPERVGEVVERFEDGTAVDGTKFMDDSWFRGTLGGCFATSLGATLHELCHTFDLGHDTKGIMGNGFNNVQKIFLDGYIAKNTEETDPFWTESQLALLNYHKWFNDYEDKRNHVLLFDSSTKVVRSTAGIRVIELRSDDNEQVVTHWVFDSKVLKYSYQINCKIADQSAILVVCDNRGNILKRPFGKLAP